MGTLSVSIRLNYQKVFLKGVRGEPLDCTMLRSQRGGRLDLRAEGSGGSRKGRGLNHIDSQERGGELSDYGTAWGLDHVGTGNGSGFHRFGRGTHRPIGNRTTKKPGVSGYTPSCTLQAAERKDKSWTSNGLW